MFELLYNFSGLNQKIFLLINHATNISILPNILQLISQPFGISKFALYYVIFITYFYLKLKKINPDMAREVNFWPIFNQMVVAGIMYACFGFTYAALKFGINLPRPFCSLPAESFTTIMNLKNERCLSTFPSAHTGLAVLIVYLMWPYLNYANKLTAVLVVILVGISRITLAMHYPADVLYSFVVIFAVILISKMIFNLFKNNLIKKVGNIAFRLI